MSLKSSHYLYRIAAVVALCAAVGFGIACILAVTKGRQPEIQLYGVAAATFAWLVWLAKKRSKALQGEQTLVSRLTTEQFFDTFLQGPESVSGVGIKWNLGTCLISGVLAAALCLGTLILAQKGLWVIAGICGLLGAVVARSLVSILRQPERLHIGPQGLTDHSRFGVIPWAAIDKVSLVESHIKGVTKAMLHVKVDSIQPYLGRIGPVKRWLWTLDPAADVIPFPLQGHDVLPLSVFQVVRHFHERALPPGSISGEDNLYMVDRNGPRRNETSETLDTRSV